MEKSGELTLYALEMAKMNQSIISVVQINGNIYRFLSSVWNIRLKDSSAHFRHRIHSGLTWKEISRLTTVHEAPFPLDLDAGDRSDGLQRCLRQT